MHLASYDTSRIELTRDLRGKCGLKRLGRAYISEDLAGIINLTVK